jgi:hypothetical protein
MSFVKRISQGQIIPAWYGVAWKDWQRDQTVCLPLGLNLLASMCRGLYFTLKLGAREIVMDPRAAYAQGLRDGKRLP